MADRPPRRRRRRAEPLRAADAVARFRRRSAGAGGAGAAAAVWPQVVGDQVARQSAPVRLSRAGVLTVACASAAWAQELSARQEDLAERLRGLLPDGGVVRLRFAVADHVPSVAAEPTPTPASRPLPPPGPAERAVGRRAAAEVSDPRLAELIARAAASAAARSGGR